MRNRTLIFIGVGIIIIGLIALVDAVTEIDLGRLLCPTILILLGVWFLIRPRLLPPETGFSVRLLGDVRRSGVWQLIDEEMWSLVGDVSLDLTEAAIPVGETTLRILGIVGDIRLTVPEDVAVTLDSTSVFTEARVLGQKHDRALAPYHYASEGYDEAERKVRFEITRIFADVRLKRTPAPTADIVS